MADCYAGNAVFNDEAFVNLNAAEVRAMWKMLIQRGGDTLNLTFEHVTANEREGSADWTARYIFSQTGRKVVNVIHARFEFENGKIVRHTDQFDFYKWSKQALGLTGLLLGKFGFFKKKVQAGARKSLEAFMKKEG